MFFLLFSLTTVNQVVAAAVPFTEHTIESGFTNAYSVYNADVDGDGDMDILGASGGNDIAWWENDGSQSFTKRLITAGNYGGAHDVHAADMDNDGDMDILGAASVDNEITWWENDGNTTTPSFTEHTIGSGFTAAVTVYAVDMNDDGHMDVLGSATGANDIAWWENDGSQSFTKHSIAGGGFAGAAYAYPADVDGDGDIDVLGAAYTADDIAWWENDGSENFSDIKFIDDDFNGAASVYAADIDGDGDIDVLGAGRFENRFLWSKNDGNTTTPSFTNNYLTDDDFLKSNSVYAADMDNDGDMDILGAGSSNDIIWWENDGNTTTPSFTACNIDDNFLNAFDVRAADIDGDGDMDVLGAALTDGNITWWENTTPDTTSPTVIFSPLNSAVEVVTSSNITITFNEAIRKVDDSEITDSNIDALITLREDNASGSDIIFDATINAEKTIITINPSSDFSSEQVVYAGIGTTVEDFSDNAITATSSTFTVADVIAPTISEGTPVSTPANDTTPSYTFTTDEVGTISYGGSCSSTVTSATFGNNEITFNTLAGGTYSDCTITVIDTSSNASNIITVTSFTIDEVNPTAILSPVDNATNIAIDSNFEITFDEDVVTSTGNITIYKISDDSTVEVIDVTGGLVTSSGTIAFVINPTSDLDYETGYYITVATSAFDDVSGNGYAGITTSTIWNFTTFVLPVISTLSSSSTETGATVTWTTDIEASSQVEYGMASSSVGDNSTTETNIGTRVTSHSVSLTSLVSCTTYYYRAKSTGAYSNQGVSVIDSFQTTGCTGDAEVINQETDDEVASLDVGKTLTLQDNSKGVSLGIPSAYNSEAAFFQIKQFDDDAVIDAAPAPSGYSLIDDLVFEFKALTGAGVEVSNFLQNITITMSYNDADVVGMTESSLAIFYWNDPNWEVISECVVDEDANTVTCETNHFSSYGLFGSPTCPTIDNAATYNSYPTCGVATCSSGYNLTGGACVAQGGGSFRSPTSPVVNQIPQIKIENGKISFEVDNVKMIAISETEDFKGVSWEPYVDSFKYGDKTLYIKFRSSEGGTSKVFIVEFKKTFVKEKVSIIKIEKEILKEVKKVFFDKNLRFGMLGVDVKELQKYLNSLGYIKIGLGSQGRETNYFGNVTKKALIEFQKDHDITPAIGYFGPLTRKAIGKVETSEEKVEKVIKQIKFSTNFKFTRSLYVGMNGEDVKNLQVYLNNNGFKMGVKGDLGSLGNETKFFGRLTKQALIKFQKSNNISPAIGYFGPLTREVINNLD